MKWGMLGHDWAIDLLKGHITSDTLRHAYLFTGPKGVGKRTLAIRFAQALNCEAPKEPAEPCLQCHTCRQIGQERYADLAIVQSEVTGKELRVDQVRELSRTLALAPYQSLYRVAILRNFEEANPNASNALLKTLEEPPPQVILIVTAQSSDDLLPTVVSRCEVLRLRQVPTPVISEHLQKQWQVDEQQATLLAHLSAGCPGQAVTLLQNPHTLAQRTAWLDEHLSLLAGTRVSRFAFVDKIYRTKEKTYIIEMIQVWLSLWRDVLLQACEASAPLVNLDKAEEIKQLAAQYKVNTCQQAVSSLMHTLDLLDQNINLRLALENLMLDLP